MLSYAEMALPLGRGLDGAEPKGGNTVEQDIDDLIFGSTETVPSER